MLTMQDRLRYLRGLSDPPLGARELSRLAGLKSEAHVGLIERGGDVRMATLVALAQVFGVSLDWLCSGEGPEPNASDTRGRVADLRAAQLDQTG